MGWWLVVAGGGGTGNGLVDGGVLVDGGLARPALLLRNKGCHDWREGPRRKGKIGHSLQPDALGHLVLVSSRRRRRRTRHHQRRTCGEDRTSQHHPPAAMGRG